MKYYLKSLQHSLLTVSILLTSLNSVEAKCPPLGRDDVRDICRWKGFHTLFGVQAGEKKIGNVTLKNIGECGEEKAITEFFLKNPQKAFYAGMFAKDLTDPSKMYCIYNIDKHPIKFEATGIDLQKESKKPEEPTVVHPKEEAHHETHPKKPKGVVGFDMTTGVMKKVPISEQQPAKKEPTRIHPQTAPQRPNQPPIPDQQTGPNPLPGKRMRAIPPQESPPPRPTQELPTQSGGTPPPSYSTPPIPQKRPLPPLPNKRQDGE